MNIFGNKTEAAIWTACTFVVVVCIGASMFIIEKRQQAWAEYAKEHNCKKVGSFAEQVNPIIGNNANGTPFAAIQIDPARIIYKCDNGNFHIR